MKLTKITPTGKNSEITVSDTLFAHAVNHQLLAQVVRVYLSNQRQGSSKAKTRSEVKRTKAKWYRQKGTGRARHGSQNAPIFVGGGVAHGPKGIENWNKTLTQKQRQAALISALSFRQDAVVVSDMPFETLGKTKHAARFLQSVGAGEQRCLLVLANPDAMVTRAFANVPLALVTTASRVTAYQVLLADQIIFSTEALGSLESRLLSPQSASKQDLPAQAQSESVPPAVKTAKRSTAKSAASKPARTTTAKAAPKKTSSSAALPATKAGASTKPTKSTKSSTATKTTTKK